MSPLDLIALWVGRTAMVIGGVFVVGAASIAAASKGIEALKFHAALLDFFWHRKAFHAWRNAAKRPGVPQ